MAGGCRVVRPGLGVPIRWSCIRREAAGIFQGLALLVRGFALVVCEDGRQGLSLPPVIPAMAPTESVLVQGHRGARAHRPENTLPAFEYALEIGVDVLELDLAITRDGVLVVSHDPYVDPARCQPVAPGASGDSRSAIRALTLDEVKQFDCGLPTLAEVFQMVTESPLPAAGRVRFNIETKSFRDTALNDYPVPPSEFAQRWLDCVVAHGMLERSILQSFDWRTLI